MTEKYKSSVQENIEQQANLKTEAATAKKKEEKLKKQAAIPVAPVLHYFDVKVETMLPATLTYRILAEDAVQAADKIKGAQPNSVHHRLIGRRDQKLTVYDAGSNMIRWMKRLVG